VRLEEFVPFRIAKFIELHAVNAALDSVWKVRRLALFGFMENPIELYFVLELFVLTNNAQPFTVLMSCMCGTPQFTTKLDFFAPVEPRHLNHPVEAVAASLHSQSWSDANQVSGICLSDAVRVTVVRDVIT